MPETPWQSGRFAGRPGPGKLLFGRVFEDSAIEATAFPAGSRVVCIASAGCTAIELSTTRTVTAVDINPVQLAYAQRRAAGAPAEPGRPTGG
jgi:S-adenosylmethionine:diacylglycerol 3-amino-3-carboxypropyl transferase